MEADVTCPSSRGQRDKRAPAAKTGLSLASAPIDAQVELIRSSLAVAISIRRKRRAPVGNTGSQDSLDRSDQARYLRSIQLSRREKGMDARSKKRFIGINVADAGDYSLVEDQCLDRGSSISKPIDQVLAGKPSAKRFWPQFRLQWIPIIGGPVFDSTKLALVAEAERLAVVEHKRDLFESHWWRQCGKHGQIAGHSEMDNESAFIIQVNQQVFASAPDIDDLAVSDQRAEGLWIQPADHRGERLHRNESNPPTDQRWQE
jgi:hypothetical protein